MSAPDIGGSRQGENASSSLIPWQNGREVAVERTDKALVSVRHRGSLSLRLSRYLWALTEAKREGKRHLSSEEMSVYTRINSTEIRRDLRACGASGKRGIGYDIDQARAAIRAKLGVRVPTKIALVGAGRLGQAIAALPTLSEHGFELAAVFDEDQRKLGEPFAGTCVVAYDRLDAIVREQEIAAAVLALPAAAVQRVVDDLAKAGVTTVYTYSEPLLRAPAGVTIESANPAVALLASLYQ